LGREGPADSRISRDHRNIFIDLRLENLLGYIFTVQQHIVAAAVLRRWQTDIYAQFFSQPGNSDLILQIEASP
jgi:hypothetical protein